MRRHLILFLVFLLPFQVFWAAVANSCEHEQEPSAQHFGHHQDEHQAPSDTSNDGEQPVETFSFTYEHNHLSSFLGLLNEPVIFDHVPSSQLLPDDIPALTSLPPGRIHRPNWSSLA